MGQIQSGIGLISGIPITDTVDKLIQLASRPRDLLQTTTDQTKAEQAVDTELAALLLSVKYITHNLGQDAVYSKLDASSSDPNALAATVTGDATAGSHQFTPLRKVQNQQWLSSSFSSETDPIGSGTVSFRFGSNVQRSARLNMLNGGAEFARGSIRITDHSGAQADIDFSAAQTIDDVLDAINGSTGLNVTATAQADHIRLTDNTGQTVGNLKVQEVGGGHTAASLGLANINAAPEVTEVDGQDIVRLYAGLNINALNDGNGVRTDPVFPDIEYQLRDGTTGTIDLSPIRPNSSEVDWQRTLGDVITVFNAANPDKLKLEIAPDGDRLIATDLTDPPPGGGSFTLTASHDSAALKDLGLDGTASDGTIVGRRILGGAGTVLLSSLSGGQGPGTLGSLDLTDRAGSYQRVDLAAAETLDDVIAAINAAGIGITARVNDARNGITLVDSTEAPTGPMIVADADGTHTATKLGIAVDDNVSSVNSGDLHLRVVAENTRLGDLNGGAGVARGTFTIHDTAGGTGTVDLRPSDIQTVGDVMRAINRLSLQVDAEINETGDGIRLIDTAGGTGTLEVDEGTSTTAHDLHLDRAATQAEVNGQTTRVIDGTTTYTVQIDADDTLTDLRGKINDLAAGISATRLVEAANVSYRLGLISQQPGRAGELVIDASGANFSLEETTRGQDALMVFGDLGAAGTSLLLSSSSNKFHDVLPGVDLEVKQSSTQPVTVTVSTSDTSLVANVKAMVDNFNKFRKRLTELTAYDGQTNKRATLTGDATALRLDIDLSYLLSGRFGTGSIQSLRQIGVTLEDDGTLALDQAALQAAYADDPQGVKQLFTAEEVGLSARFDGLIEQIAGEGNSLLIGRIGVLNDKIQWNQDRIEAMNKHLEAERQRLLTQFYRMELAIGQMQSYLSVINSIQPIDMLAFTAASNG